MIARVRVAAALAVSVLLAACSGGGSSGGVNVVPPVGNAGAVAPARKLSIVGVGDSLTAGTQSGGTMGASIPGPLGTIPGVGLIAPPPLGVPATQENGFFALLWEQANGVGLATMSDPATSPLPLLKPPGIGGLLAPTQTHIFPAPVSNTCDASQIPANQFSASFVVDALLDGVVDGDQSVNVGVTATGYQAATAHFTVQDIDVPALKLSILSASVTNRT